MPLLASDLIRFVTSVHPGRANGIGSGERRTIRHDRPTDPLQGTTPWIHESDGEASTSPTSSQWIPRRTVEGRSRPGRRPWRWRDRRVVWTPLCGSPLVAKRALQLASEQVHALGHDEVSPEHLLLGVLEDAGQPLDLVRGPRRHRQVAAHVGLPDGYRGTAGLLLAALEVDLDRLRDAAAKLSGIR